MSLSKLFHEKSKKVDKRQIISPLRRYLYIMSAEETHEAYMCGKSAVREKTHDLMVEVMDTYKSMQTQYEKGSSEYQVLGAQANAVEFTLDWVKSGGHTDFDGNRVCLPW